MNKHLFKLDLKLSRLSLILWTSICAGVILITILIYPLVKDMFHTIPEEILEIFGGLASLPENVVEYYATQNDQILLLAGSIFSCLVGFNILKRDERFTHSELNYTLPISRQVIFKTRLIQTIMQILIFSTVVMVVSLLGFVIIDKVYFLSHVLLFFLMYTIMLLVIGILSFAVAAITKPKQSATAAVLVLALFFIIFIISNISNNKAISFLRHFTVYSFGTSFNYLLGKINFEYVSLILFIVITTISLTFSYNKFKDKDFDI